MFSTHSIKTLSFVQVPSWDWLLLPSMMEPITILTAVDPSGGVCRHSNQCHWYNFACTCFCTHSQTHRTPTWRPRMRSRPAPVVSILSIGRAVGGVAILAILLAVGGPVPLWLLTVCHTCLLGIRGGEGSPVVSKGGGREKRQRII